jgi:hypothetical protein
MGTLLSVNKVAPEDSSILFIIDWTSEKQSFMDQDFDICVVQVQDQAFLKRADKYRPKETFSSA